MRLMAFCIAVYFYISNLTAARAATVVGGAMLVHDESWPRLLGQRFRESKWISAGYAASC